jgi:GH25 family lysozyme M1 (1,4-beta-N-acetylmuramidase)
MNFQGIIGFDVSKWQGAIDFQKMKGGGASFVIMKAGQGNWPDPNFETNWKNAKGVLPRATYWYFDNRYPPKDQAEKYFEIIKGDLDGMCWLDLEDRQAGLYAGWRSWYDFCEALKLTYPGARIGIYSNFYYIMEMLSYATREQRQYFAQYPLWLANYGSDPFHPNYSTIMTPLPWLDYLILQSGTPAIGLDAGVSSLEIDYNQFDGDLEKFAQYFGGVVPPVEGAIMTRYEAVSTYTMSLRPDHNTANTPLGSIPAQSKIHGDVIWEAPGEKWLQVTDVNGVAKTGWVAIVSASRIYCALTDNGTPPVVEVPDFIVAHFANGVEKKYVPE